jgi:hypothetical protein
VKKRPKPSQGYILPPQDPHSLSSVGERLKEALEQHIVAVLATVPGPVREATLERVAGFAEQPRTLYLVSAVLPSLAAQGLVVFTTSGTVLQRILPTSGKAQKRREFRGRAQAVRDRLSAEIDQWQNLSRATAGLYARKRFGAFFASGGRFEEIWTWMDHVRVLAKGTNVLGEALAEAHQATRSKQTAAINRAGPKKVIVNRALSSQARSGLQRTAREFNEP